MLLLEYAGALKRRSISEKKQTRVTLRCSQLALELRKTIAVMSGTEQRKVLWYARPKEAGFNAALSSYLLAGQNNKTRPAMRSAQDYRELAALYADFVRQMSDATASKEFQDTSVWFASCAQHLENERIIPDIAPSPGKSSA